MQFYLRLIYILFNYFLELMIFQDNNVNNRTTNLLSNNNSLENILYLFDINKIISEIVNNQRNDRLSFVQKYNYFRKCLNINSQKRKTQIDSILKKCKTYFSKGFYGILIRILEIRGKNYKLPQNFVTNININI